MRVVKQGQTDKKQHFHLSFNIPVWLYRPFEDAAYQLRKWAYWANPDRCGCCGKRMFVRWYEIEHIFDNGKRLVVGNQVVAGGTAVPVCRDCIANELEKHEWAPRFSRFHKSKGRSSRHSYRFWSTKKCAITGKEVRSFKDVEAGPYIDMTFCTTSWNHDYVSKEAVLECVKKGRITTSLWGVYKRKRMAPTNHKKLFIDEEGNLL